MTEYDCGSQIPENDITEAASKLQSDFNTYAMGHSDGRGVLKEKDQTIAELRAQVAVLRDALEEFTGELK